MKKKKNFTTKCLMQWAAGIYLHELNVSHYETKATIIGIIYLLGNNKNKANNRIEVKIAQSLYYPNTILHRKFQ